MHFVQAFSEAAFRHDHFNAVREVALTGSRAAFVAGHWRTPCARTEAMVTGSTIMGQPPVRRRERIEENLQCLQRVLTPVQTEFLIQ